MTSCTIWDCTIVFRVQYLLASRSIFKGFQYSAAVSTSSHIPVSACYHGYTTSPAFIPDERGTALSNGTQVFWHHEQYRGPCKRKIDCGCRLTGEVMILRNMVPLHSDRPAVPETTPHRRAAWRSCGTPHEFFRFALSLWSNSISAPRSTFRLCRWLRMHVAVHQSLNLILFFFPQSRAG